MIRSPLPLTSTDGTRRIGSIILAALGLLLPVLLHAQPYRFFEDSTRGDQVIPKHLGHEIFPIGVFFYAYDYGQPAPEMWDYVTAIESSKLTA